MEDDSDIYSDLPNCNFDDEIEELKASNKSLSNENTRLQEQLVQVTKERDEYQIKCTTLTTNISSLLKTAQAEIQRKEKLIKELRDQIKEYTLKRQCNRKRKCDRDIDSDVGFKSKRSANGLSEEQKSAVIDPIISKQITSTSSENKSISINNNVTVNSFKQDESATSSNTEIRQHPKRLPFANVHCKTVYSQRMLNKLRDLSTTNGCSVVSKTTNDKENHNNDNISDRNDSGKSPGVYLTDCDKAKENEEQKSVDTTNKGDVTSPSLIPAEVNGIKKLPNSVVTSDKKLREDNVQPTNVELMTPVPVENNQLDALFGSPLKWTESSNETNPPQVAASTSPTVYEDSCSAHIENAKFSLNFNKPNLPKPVNPPKCTTPKITPINKSTFVNHRQEIKQNIPDKEKPLSNETKWVRAFENVSALGMQKNQNRVFPPLLRKDASKLSTITVNVGKESSLDIPPNFLFRSGYEDSVLGQFDDTTQFVSALTKVESKISPLNTPVKTTQILPVNISQLGVNTTPTTQKVVAQGGPDTLKTNQVTDSTSLPVSKGINEKPINILQPRKTPRIVNYNKSKETNPKPSATVAQTPTKINRFAINEEFISKQEEKVLKKSFINVKDTIAISISSKSKIRSKDCLSARGRTIRVSPKGKTNNLNISNMKKSKLSDCPKERDVSSIEKTGATDNNLLQNAAEQTPVNQVTLKDPSNKVVEKNLSKSHVNDQENTLNLNGNSEKHLSKQYWNTQENLPVQDGAEKQQSTLHKSISHNPPNFPRSIEKQLPKLRQMQLENQSKLRKSPDEHLTNLPPSIPENPSTLPRSNEKLPSKSCHNQQENLNRKSSEKYLSTNNQSNSEKTCNLPRSLEKPHQSNQNLLERQNFSIIYNKQQCKTNLSISNLPRIHEKWQQSRVHQINQEKPTKEHLSAEERSSYLLQTPDGAISNHLQRTRENQSKGKVTEKLPTPETNLIKSNKRCEEKERISSDETKPNLHQDSMRKEKQRISSDEAKRNLYQNSKKKEKDPISSDVFQESKNKKVNILPNSVEKRTSRVQNFKPSSQLKKQADSSFLRKEKCDQSKVSNETNDDNKSPKNCKSYNKNSSVEKVPTSDNHRSKDSSRVIKKLPMIVRSSKKPEFVSTTVSDDDYASRTPTKSSELIKRSSSEVIELMEWVLKPITFDNDDKSDRKSKNVGDERTILKNKEMQPNDSKREMQNKTDSLVSPICSTQSKVTTSAPSPNKIIRARRPLNFGVTLVTH